MRKTSASRTDRMQRSPNYKNGVFQNLSPTPTLAEDASMLKVLKEAVSRPKTVKPATALPSVKTDLKELYADEPVIVWFGHSSYLVHVKGFNILVDPVFSGSASPVPVIVKAFAGADAYNVADMPDIDVLLITHNHYDHLDRRTVIELMPKVKAVYTSLGVGDDLECYKIPQEKITELDWWEGVEVRRDIQLTATPARHFSGRGLKRGGTLWSSFVLNIHGYNIFLGGDSGYDFHFNDIGNKYGPFDIAILECGQYNKAWPHIHMMPEETVQASIDLKAKVLFPVHWGKFTLANHPWNEPIIRAVTAAGHRQVKITHPMIGEPVMVNRHYPDKMWWDF